MRDRWVAISVSTEEEWTGFNRALGYPEWTKNPEFSTLAGRLANRQDLDNFIQTWTAGLTAEEAAASLQKEGVPASIVRDAADLAQDPQLRERGFFVELEHPELGRITADASPIRLSESPAKYRRAAPTQGQDNDYVYRELLGLSDNEINALKANRVI
jgi:crotonobetainyl-CoA:carnitine CoA-transferase CaiB-like acyl-CoA transferase